MERVGRREMPPSSWETTPHFFLHNFWHLPACKVAFLSISEKRGHTLIVMLGE